MRCKILFAILLAAVLLTGCSKNGTVKTEPLSEYIFYGQTGYYDLIFTEKTTSVKDRAGLLDEYVTATAEGYTVTYEGQEISSPILFEKNSLFTCGQLLNKILTEQIVPEESSGAGTVTLSGNYKGAPYTLTLDKEKAVPLTFEYNGTVITFKGSI